MWIDLVLAYCECGDVARAVDIGEQALAAMADLRACPPEVSHQVELKDRDPGGLLPGNMATSAEPSSSPTVP